MLLLLVTQRHTVITSMSRICLDCDRSTAGKKSITQLHRLDRKSETLPFYGSETVNVKMNRVLRGTARFRNTINARNYKHLNKKLNFVRSGFKTFV